MDSVSKIVLGLVGSVLVVTTAMAIHVNSRSKEAKLALKEMEIELKLVHTQFNEADISKIQAERAIDVIIDKFKIRYLIYTSEEKTEVNQFFESHRVGHKKLLGSM